MRESLANRQPLSCSFVSQMCRSGGLQPVTEAYGAAHHPGSHSVSFVTGRGNARQLPQTPGGGGEGGEREHRGEVTGGTEGPSLASSLGFDWWVLAGRREGTSASEAAPNDCSECREQ